MTSPQHLQGLLADLGLEEAATFTAVHGRDEDAVIRLFGGNAEQCRPLRLEELREHYEGDLILVSRSGPAVIVVENNNYQGSREEVLRPLSRHGRTASAYWNVNAVSRLSLAEGGLISSAFEMLAPESTFGARPDAWQPLLEGLDLDDDHLWGVGLAAVERATGARFDTSWVRGPHRAVQITRVPEYLLGQGLIDSPLLKREPFISYLAGPGPSQLEPMRRHALDLALAHADLREHPLAVAALAAATLAVDARVRLREDLTAAHDQALPRGRALLIGEPEDFEPEWERPSHLVFRQAIVFGVLAQCVAAHPPTPSEGLPDILDSLVTAMTGDGARVEEFWMVKHLHDAARRAA
ncbi:hypothetical protein GCM10010277_81800 [Streptomyces longisporoflavus]|uniref:DUF6461 domain-containing protein n=1 Tax=Streptomyces longisporoflavus TaxID=28044 RepID=UPI00167D58E1|nr:DUF6461 domain-containing protein [Streptomyces longisporoflavus]GGV70625.1 hypothetical protein GCM10010277_81800 [Streptomyces longisporoflavus]